MITIKPFRGLRPEKGHAADIVSPPYDVLDTEEAREFAKRRKHSFLHVSKPEIDLPRGIDLHDPRVYAKGMENLKTFIDRNLLIQDESPGLYIYKLKLGDHQQIGLMTVAAVEDYVADRIKKHENTRFDKEEDRASHIDCLNAQTGPAFLLYRAREDIGRLLKEGISGKPEYNFIGAYEVEHTLFIVQDPGWIEKMVAAFRTVDALYIADGHHRTAAAARVCENRMKNNPAHSGKEPYNFFLTVIFPHDQLHILDYNRAVKDLNNYSPNAFIEALRDNFSVKSYTPAAGAEKQYHPQRFHEFGMYLRGKWHRLTARPGTFDENDPVEVLDVNILQQNLLAPILDIQNPRTDNRIHFVGGIRGLGELEQLVDSGEYAVAFSMHPTSIDQLMAIADAGRVMPPKSTWFEPKLGDGLVTHLLNID